MGKEPTQHELKLKLSKIRIELLDKEKENKMLETKLRNVSEELEEWKEKCRRLEKSDSKLAESFDHLQLEVLKTKLKQLEDELMPLRQIAYQKLKRDIGKLA